MKKKNLAALLMAGAMCLSLLAGCSGGDGGESNPPASDAGAQESAPAGNGNQGGQTTGTAGGTFKLGGIGPLTGENAIYGKAAMNGADRKSVV